MKTIELTTEELKCLVSFLACTDANLSRYVAIARNEQDKKLFDTFVTDKKLLTSILEKLIRK